MPLLSIITVGMNHLSYLKSFYKSLYENQFCSMAFEAVYVDNCSSDGSVDYIRDNYPLVRIIQNIKPLGFGENNNNGVAVAKGDIIGIVNPDIVLLDNSIDIIIDFLKHHDKCIVAPQLLNPDKTLQYSVRRFITLKFFFNRIETKGKDNSKRPKIGEYLCKDLDMYVTQPIDWAIGAALFMKRDVYDRLGGFDERYFLYMEDEDLCLRAWKMGIPVFYEPSAKMIHNHLRASSKLGKKTFYHIKSLITFFRRHGINVHRVEYEILS